MLVSKEMGVEGMSALRTFTCTPMCYVLNSLIRSTQKLDTELVKKFGTSVGIREAPLEVAVRVVIPLPFRWHVVPSRVRRDENVQGQEGSVGQERGSESQLLLPNVLLQKCREHHTIQGRCCRKIVPIMLIVPIMSACLT